MTNCEVMHRETDQIERPEMNKQMTALLAVTAMMIVAAIAFPPAAILALICFGALVATVFDKPGPQKPPMYGDSRDDLEGL